MQVHQYRVATAPGQPHWRFLCSDVHLGSPNCDEKRFVKDLHEAKAAGARVLINGDLFDAIGPGDKRHTPTTLIRELRQSEDLKRDTVKHAAKLIEPYADAIDVIGIGNHEEAWIKWGQFDPVADLIEKLNAGLEKQGASHRIRHGGICGWVRTVFEVRDTGNKARAIHRLYYFHGSGGDAPVTKGVMDSSRKACMFDYDTVTHGHKHNRTFVDDVMIGVTPKGYIRCRERKAIQTGSYYLNYRQGSLRRPLDYSYATSKHHAPKPVGGMFLVLTPVRERLGPEAGDRATGSFWVVRQDVCTSALGLPTARPTPA